MHDVDWPYGRRDMYYQPDTVPAEFRRAYAYRGVIRGQNQLDEINGSDSPFANAIDEGGPRNGVLTAVEDFHAQHAEDYRFFRVKTQYGLGVLQLRTPGLQSAWRFYSFRLKSWVYAFIRSLRGSVRQPVPEQLPDK
jgi:hypothetical protein